MAHTSLHSTASSAFSTILPSHSHLSVWALHFTSQSLSMYSWSRLHCQRAVVSFPVEFFSCCYQLPYVVTDPEFFQWFLESKISSPAADMASFNLSHDTVYPDNGSAKADNLLFTNVWNWACLVGFFSLLMSYQLDFTSFFSCLLSFTSSFAMAKWWSLHTSAPLYTPMSLWQGVHHLSPIAIWSICVSVMWSLEVQVNSWITCV